MKIFVIHEYDKEGYKLSQECFCSEKEQQKRLLERKKYPYGTCLFECITVTNENISVLNYCNKYKQK